MSGQPAPALKISSLTKTYDNGFEALKGIDLEVAEGAFFALLGPNGAGKSTTIGIVASLVSKSGGKVWIHGIDIDENFPLAKKQIGIVPQEFNFNIFEKVEDILLNQAGYYGMPRAEAKVQAEHYLKKLGLYEKRNTTARMLSGGMKRRLMIARALIHSPKLLILDEPTAGVDIEMRRSMYDFLKEINKAGTTIILTTHYLEEAEALCRDIAIINHGAIVTNRSIKSLLRDLNREVFMLDSSDTLPDPLTLEGFTFTRIDDNSLEVEIERGQDLSEVFSQLRTQGVSVVSMRNSANRLEQMFVNLLEESA
ncbi:ribosomal protein S16 [Luminiphilus syltensis NOR5-1B]|uniref:Ribosomal protein S16 n=1 Tax=Luminiphilus syltensis NOR5-1B TaxID=565045 RepID=B8KRQ6_9GAMM|nr:ABC transporter ATP-binding protein [Luminiphilus syltensis]EED35034.1 ribosomal protein S16 [Luminiphilus syltensis NOR5-1B]